MRDAAEREIRCPSCGQLLGRVVPLGGAVVEVTDGERAATFRSGTLTCCRCDVAVSVNRLQRRDPP